MERHHVLLILILYTDCSSEARNSSDQPNRVSQHVRSKRAFLVWHTESRLNKFLITTFCIYATPQALKQKAITKKLDNIKQYCQSSCYVLNYHSIEKHSLPLYCILQQQQKKRSTNQALSRRFSPWKTSPCSVLLCTLT